MDNSVQHNYRYIQVQRVSAALGAEIDGIDLTQPLKREVVTEIRQAFLDYACNLLPEPKTYPTAAACLCPEVRPANGISTVEGFARLAVGHSRNQAGA